MKRLLILLALVALVTMPVQAAYFEDHPLISTGASYGAPVNRNSTINVTTSGDEICAAYGKTSPFSYIYVGHIWENLTLNLNPPPGGFYGSYFTTVPYSYNMSTDGADRLTHPKVAIIAQCSPDNHFYTIELHEYYNSSADYPAPIANFTGAPVAGVAPLNVAFTDTSENEYGTCTYNWSITPTSNVTGYIGTAENHNAVFAQNGNYTVSHTVSCLAGSNTSTKTDYISVMNSTATVTTAFRATDGATGNRITGATIHLNDVENGSWSNSSTNLGVATITVLVGHHISAYATALGFDDGEYLNAPAMAWTYDIMMLPTGFANVSAGNVTAYITVTDADTLQKLYGAQVNALYATGEGSFILESQTNSAGVASFVLPNNTNVHFVGVKSGYESSQLVLNTGTGSGGDAHVEGELKMSKLSVTPTITATTLPGGGTPVPTLTYLKYCNPTAADYDEALCRSSKGGVGLNLLADYMDDLILLCIFVTIMYLLGFKLGS